MISKILDTIKQHEMLENTSNIVMGLSGGADSVALTHFLHSLICKENFTLTAVHINHGIRGAEAERDENFVRDFCNSLDIALVVKRVDVLGLSKELKIGIEEAGRKVRYETFKEVASRKQNSKIATAHTLSDNVETVLMRLASGSGLKGLCGIPPVRENIMRPLINVKREEIEDYCRKNNLKYVNDSSNFERDYTRNKLRLDIIPRFKNINFDFESNIARFISTIRKDENYLNDLAECKLREVTVKDGYDVDKMNSFPESLENRVLIKVLKSFTKNRIEQKHVSDLKEIINKKSGKICIPGNKFVICKNGILFLEKNQHNSKVEWEYLIKPLNILTEIKTNIIINTMDISKYHDWMKSMEGKKYWVVDYDKLPIGSVFRNRRPGDVFKFSSRGLTKSIKKIFNEMKIPLDMRERIPLLAFGKNIIWADNIGVSKDYTINKNTKKISIIIKE